VFALCTRSGVGSTRPMTDGASLCSTVPRRVLADEDEPLANAIYLRGRVGEGQPGNGEWRRRREAGARGCETDATSRARPGRRAPAAGSSASTRRAADIRCAARRQGRRARRRRRTGGTRRGPRERGGLDGVSFAVRGRGPLDRWILAGRSGFGPAGASSVIVSWAEARPSFCKADFSMAHRGIFPAGPTMTRGSPDQRLLLRFLSATAGGELAPAAAAGERWLHEARGGGGVKSSRCSKQPVLCLLPGAVLNL
jgi:hypothetical protein